MANVYEISVEYFTDAGADGSQYTLQSKLQEKV